MPNFLSPIVKDPEREYALRNERTGQVLADRVEGAFDSSSRRKGLLGRDAFAEGQALIIAPSNAIHTFRMRFPIDVAFVRRDGRILKCRQDIGPSRISASLRAYAVIELPAGTLARHETRTGDVLSIVPAISGAFTTERVAQAG